MGEKDESGRTVDFLQSGLLGNGGCGVLVKWAPMASEV